MHTVFALLCFVVVIHWLIFPYPPGLLRWHCGNLTIAPVPAKQPWWIWINTSCEIIMNDYITRTKQNTTKPCAYLLGYTVQYSHGNIASVQWSVFFLNEWRTRKIDSCLLLIVHCVLVATHSSDLQKCINRSYDDKQFLTFSTRTWHHYITIIFNPQQTQENFHPTNASDKTLKRPQFVKMISSLQRGSSANGFGQYGFDLLLWLLN